MAPAARQSEATPGEADTRTWLFTGIGGILGTAFSESVKSKGGRLIGIGRSRLPPGSVAHPWPADKVEDRGVTCFGYLADLLDDDALETSVRAAVSTFGAIDVVVNAARHTWVGPITEEGNALDSLEEQFYVNVVAPARLTALVSELSWQHRPDENSARNRHVVNLSSTAGHVLYPGRGQGAYATTKAAVNMLTRHQALELASIGVRVNAIAPNTFPGIVSTTSVLEAIFALDDSVRSGDVLVIDADGSNWM
jgi:NAD(P)-dependent dehydrogenase (short-subunit alcohol dehydrogenase family)